MTRVLHVITGLGLGGAETVLYRLLTYLRNHPQQKHEIVSLTPECRFDFEKIGVPVRVVDLKGLGPFRGIRSLRRAIVEASPDVIHGWMLHGCLASTLIAPCGIPVIWGLHHSLSGIGAEKRGFRVLIGLGAFVSRLPCVQRILFVSGKSRDEHVRSGYPEARCDVIPNGFDLGVFQPDAAVHKTVREALGQGESRILIGNVGRVHPAKNHGLLIRAFASVAEDFPEARLVLVGDGTLNGSDSFQSLVNGSGVQERILLLGPRSDIAAIYNALDIYAMSSLTEAFPNVLGEACATGVPCLVTDVGDSALILGGTGRVVPSNNEAAFAKALRELLALSSEALAGEGKRARAHIAAHFDQTRVAETYRALYEKVASS